MNKRMKVKITSFVILVGMASMFTAVVTDHWAVLSPEVQQFNATCEAVHFGLWRLCKKAIYISEGDNNGKGCGPISLPGEPQRLTGPPAYTRQGPSNLNPILGLPKCPRSQIICPSLRELRYQSGSWVKNLECDDRNSNYMPATG
ncbi:hypothetical protein DPEC_G00176350 [Dallia pectoralis]|uniref:Uncharacterized protein n=1 Tax=Dallia pectoralis TaxID=75939 RepID=A0ACC2GF31_DALPE|nr:hypothetical protein DPEC_G00176350 [Dallia pectoralis]